MFIIQYNVTSLKAGYDNIHEKLFWRFFKACDKNIDLILEINIF